MNSAGPWPRFPLAPLSDPVLHEQPPASFLPPLPLPDFQQQPQPSSFAVAAIASAESDALSSSAQHQAQTASAAPLFQSPFSPDAASFTAPLLQQVQGSSAAALAAPSSEPPIVDPFPGWPATADASSPLDSTSSVPTHASAPEAAAEPSGLLSDLQHPLQSLPALPSAQSSTAPRGRIVLTESAAQMMLEMHTGEREILQPLDVLEVSGLVSQVCATALERFGSPLRRSMAVTALEVSRQMPGASGFPQLEEALACLRPLSRPAPPTPTAPRSAAQPPLSTGVRVTPPPVPPLAPSDNARSLLPRSGVPSLSALMPPPAAPVTHQVSLTGAAQRDLFFLQTGQWMPLPSLDDFRIAQLISSLQSVIPSRFGVSASLEHRIALDAVELSRYLPQAAGQPSLAGALSCLEQQPLQPPAASRPLDHNQVPFFRRASGSLPPPPSEGLVPRPPPVHPYVNSGLVNSARLRKFAPPSLFGPTPRNRDRGQHLLCPSCGVAGHDALHCPQGLDVSAVVTAAQELGLASQQRLFELSGSLQSGGLEASRVVRDEVVDSIAEISGISSHDISSHLDGGSGDAEATFVSAVCHSRGGPDSQFFHDACTRELHRRRHHVRVAEASRVASSAPDNDAAYRSLASRVNLPAQLGYGYRAGPADDLQLPTLPSRPVNLRRRRRADDDLSDFVVDDHSSDPQDSPPPSRRRRPRDASNSSKSSPSESSSSGSGDGDDSVHDNDSAFEGDGGSDNSDGDISSSDNSGSDGRDRDDDVDGRAGRSASLSDRNPDTPLTAESLGKILKTLLDKRSKSSNSGLLASKTPSFWDLGKAPVGGYFAPTFSKVYGEFRQFRNVFGKRTGVTFKNLILEDMIPMIRDDLNISRREWRKISDKELVRKLKRRLGFRERDAYISELEACPRLTSNLRDVHVLNTKFKEMAAQMLSICERARTHGVKLKKPSCKHVFGEAVKNCYRVNQWFRLRPFKSIGDSVRDINSKLARRLSSAAEQRHENAMDEAKLNGVRSQIGSGTTEGSNAPDRKKGKVKGGIDKKGQDKSKAERDKHSKKMDTLYKVENELEKGRFWHAKTPFCDGDNCTLKICQGCGVHQVPGKPWHDRPRCNCRKHPDFVETGYFHDKWPNRLSIHDKSSKDSGRQQSQGSHSNSNSNSNSNYQRTNYAARSNFMAGDDAPAGGDK
jgi:hypothetical protein